MKTLIVFIIAVAFLTLGGVSSIALAHSSDDLNLQAAVQSIGSSTRAEITRIGDQGANVSRALSLQAQGDQALRRGELALAAENYGRAREALSVLDRERSLAATERTRAAGDLQRAQRDGDDIAWAAAKVSEGNRAFAAGNYITSDIDYAEARADLIGG